MSIADDEAQQKKFRQLQPPRRAARYSAPVAVEHALAHIAARKGSRARYLGVRKNLFDLRRAASIENLEAVHRVYREAA